MFSPSPACGRGAGERAGRALQLAKVAVVDHAHEGEVAQVRAMGA
ncbi:hypothetical protein CBM2589_A80019 [Cupriavidus taiwanensis]|uniref:Uncharacterized protein n=1 Tax=Cupriavidus taiwanensis TaxID=164546 RepID=A0A975XG38_9BURK|nr:hypothetical protein CBM2589_A80019 [Cupriavidus taiwanensis]